ncbi:MAG: DUF429 domain-containing protein [Candidatus Aenigmatarchaeota archaeon]
MKVVGIDLAGKPENPTGFCVLEADGEVKTEIKILKEDSEIIAAAEDAKPDCIAIDAPFWIPQTGFWRRSEELLMKRGFKVVSPKLPSMQILAFRAKGIVESLRKKGFIVIEVSASATEKILQASREPKSNEHEYEALLCALTAKFYLDRKFDDLEGIIIPR